MEQNILNENTDDKGKTKEPTIDEMQIFVRRKVIELVNIDGSVEWNQFEEFCRHFDKCTLREVAEERALGEMCAYPPCERKPTTSASTAESQIYSIKNKHVYDVSERARFCSNKCYAYYRHIEHQLPDDPIWLQPSPLVQLDRPNANKCPPLPGQPIEFTSQQIETTTKILERQQISGETADKIHEIDTRQLTTVVEKIKENQRQKSSQTKNARSLILIDPLPLYDNACGDFFTKIPNNFEHSYTAIKKILCEWQFDQAIIKATNINDISDSDQPMDDDTLARVMDFYRGDHDKVALIERTMSDESRSEQTANTGEAPDTEMSDVPEIDSLKQHRLRVRIVLDQLLPHMRQYVSVICASSSVLQNRAVHELLKRCILECNLTADNVLVENRLLKLLAATICLKTCHSIDPMLFDDGNIENDLLKSKEFENVNTVELFNLL